MKEFKFLGRTFFKKEDWSTTAQRAVMDFNKTHPQASYYGESYPIFETVFDGEKTPGELGAPLSYLPDYNALSFRSWKAFTDSDLAKIIIMSHVNWVIGSGLKLQAEPIEGVIEGEGFKFDKDDFVKNTEERFRLYAKSEDSVHSRMMNYNKYQRVAYLNASVGGDVLCIERLENGLPTKQLVDGVFVQQPGIDEITRAEGEGNQIIHGVEINKRGEHIRFYVLKNTSKTLSSELTSFQKIEAIGKNTGKKQAYLLYGSEYRIDSVRGMPLLSATLQKMSELDNYNESIVSGAVERAKVPYTFEHKEFSDGTNPDLAKVTSAITGEAAPAGAKKIDMTEATKLVKKTYGKEPINLPVGAVMKKLDSGMEKDQDVFTTGNFIYICAASEVPYEVALMKYVNSFSSSRMASQTWATLLQMKRVAFNDTYNKPFYNLFLDSQILSGKITANGYFSAQNSEDVILLGAYRNARFIGPSVPQADPFKEVKAIELLLELKLISHDEALEMRGGSDDFESTLNKLANEQKLIDEKLPDPEPTEPNVNIKGAD